MNKTFWSVLALSVLTTASVTAQDSKSSKTKEEKKEIVIEEKSSGKNEKMVIVIDGDKITINGKPADDYKGNKRIIIDDDISINGDEVHIPRKGRMYMRGFEGGNRAMLGVVTEKADKGVKIKEVTKASAAEKAGLKAGDVITKVNGKPVNEHGDIVDAIAPLKPNDLADITYLRDGKEKKVKATLGKSDAPMAMTWNMDKKNFDYQFRMEPPMAMIAPHPPHAPNEPYGPKTFIYNDEDMWMFRNDRPKYGMSIEDNADGDGVKITGVDSAGNAMKAGIKENDIITEVEGKPVKGTDELKDILGDVEDKSSISVKVLRNGSAQNITLRVPKLIKKADL
jgi:serine protease Do